MASDMQQCASQAAAAAATASAAILAIVGAAPADCGKSYRRPSLLTLPTAEKPSSDCERGGRSSAATATPSPGLLGDFFFSLADDGAAPAGAAAAGSAIAVTQTLGGSLSISPAASPAFSTRGLNSPFRPAASFTFNSALFLDADDGEERPATDTSNIYASLSDEYSEEPRQGMGSGHSIPVATMIAGRDGPTPAAAGINRSFPAAGTDPFNVGGLVSTEGADLDAADSLKLQSAFSATFSATLHITAYADAVSPVGSSDDEESTQIGVSAAITARGASEDTNVVAGGADTSNEPAGREAANGPSSGSIAQPKAGKELRHAASSQPSWDDRAQRRSTAFEEDPGPAPGERPLLNRGASAAGASKYATAQAPAWMTAPQALLPVAPTTVAVCEAGPAASASPKRYTDGTEWSKTAVSCSVASVKHAASLSPSRATEGAHASTAERMATVEPQTPPARNRAAPQPTAKTPKCVKQLNFNASGNPASCKPAHLAASAAASTAVALLRSPAALQPAETFKAPSHIVDPKSLPQPQRQLAEIAADLGALSGEQWPRAVALLQRLQAVVSADNVAAHGAEVFAASILSMALLISIQLVSRRLEVASQACELVSHLAATLGESFEATALALLPATLKAQVAGPRALGRSNSLTTLRAIARHCASTKLLLALAQVVAVRCFVFSFYDALFGVHTS